MDEYIVEYKKLSNAPEKIRVKNCINKEHAEVKFRKYTRKHRWPYTVVLDVYKDASLPDGLNMFKDIFGL